MNQILDFGTGGNNDNNNGRNKKAEKNKLAKFGQNVTNIL